MESVSTPGGPASPSRFPDDRPDIPQEGVAINNRRRAVLDNPLLADDALRIDKKK